MKVFIDPRARISYASFYIEGLYRLFGKSLVTFGKKHFSDLIQTNGIEDFDHYFTFVIIDNSSSKRIVIDYRDKNTVNQNALSWADIYGKVNYNKAVILQSGIASQNRKIVPIGPNFGIKIWNNYQSIYYLIRNYLSSFKQLPVSLMTFVSGYNWQRKRPVYDYYRHSISDSDYIFFASTLYGKESYALQTNKFRAAFIRACKTSAINIEGGLLAKPEHPEFKMYEDVITTDYVQPNEYLNKIRKSAVVFNTPAVWDCHGWKLGEFLAMGKAIISTPLSNEMPFPLLHGEHIHIVESEVDIKSAVEKIVTDQTYRLQLENGARAYFDKYLAPEIVVKRLIDSLN